MANNFFDTKTIIKEDMKTRKQKEERRRGGEKREEGKRGDRGMKRKDTCCNPQGISTRES